MCDVEKNRIANAALPDEIEVTPAMIEAGETALFGYDYFSDVSPRLVVRDVYRAMAALDSAHRGRCGERL